MKITAIRQQQRQTDRYSFYVDGQYAFSLSEAGLLEQRLVSGQELEAKELERLKQLSSEDKLFGRALRYVAMRPRSIWEMETYLKKHHSPAPLIEQITNKLLRLGLLDDFKVAAAIVHDRLLLRPTSRRRLELELRKKRLLPAAIEAALGGAEAGDSETLPEVITKMRRRSRYASDDQKLMQYLARQGYNYGDIKTALGQDLNYD